LQLIVAHIIEYWIFCVTWDEEVALFKGHATRIAALHEKRRADRPLDGIPDAANSPTNRSTLDDGAAVPAHGCARRRAATPAAHAASNAADKRIINGQTDVSQLVPFKYKWAWEKYLATCANHWMPGSEHDARHRALERPERPDRRRRRIIKRNLASSYRRCANNIWAPIATSPRPGAVSSCCARPLRSDPHARLPVHRRVARPGRKRDLQRLQR
jgi:hypothetical protein